MSRPIRYYVTWLLLVSVLTLGMKVGAKSALAQDPPAPHAQALKTLSDYMVGRYDHAGKLLKKYNYAPPAAIASSWHSYPAVKKLEIAYLAAETATPRGGGDKLLALLSQDLARQYESVRKNELLRKYVETEAVTSPPPFKNPSPIPQSINLDARVSSALDVLSNYYVRGPLGSPQTVLTKYFGLSQQQAYQLLAQSETHPDAFKSAMNRLTAGNQLDVLKRLTNDLKPRYEGLSYEPSLAALKLVEPPDQNPLVPPHRTTGPTPNRSRGRAAAPTVTNVVIPEMPRLNPNPISPSRPMVPPRSASLPSAPERYRGFLRTNYPNVASRAFARMARSFRGFGGVVFGNEVTAEVGPSRLLRVFFEEGNTPGLGTLWCQFADGSFAGLPNVKAGDAYAAYEIYYPTNRLVLPPRAGEGVGLVGVDEHVPYVECKTSATTLREGSLFNVVMHPALADLDLGWSAIMVDTAPIEPGALLEQLRVESAEGSDAIERLFKALDSQTEISLGTWKVADVPMTILRRGNVLTISRTASSPEDFPEGLRKSAFLEMRNMTLSEEQGFAILLGEEVDNEYDRDLADEFYRLLPVLAKSSRDYDRLNGFAPILGLFRWAKQQRAVISRPPKRPSNTKTPDAVLISESNVLAIEPFKPLEAYKQTQSAIATCLNEIESSSSVAEFKKTALPILQELRTHATSYAKAPPSSPEAKQALEGAKDARARMKALAAEAAKKPELAYWNKLIRLQREVEVGVASLEREN